MKIISYAERAHLSKNPITKTLFSLIENKQSNLCLSADVTQSAKLLELANDLGSEICLLKTHIDILDDFTPELTRELQHIAKQKNFLLFEDRKFADIGQTVKHQFNGGIYRIADWADIINAHSLPGPGVIAGLREAKTEKQTGLLLLAEMSSAGNLCDTHYTKKTLDLATQFPDFVIGFIAQHMLNNNPEWITLTPGVQYQTKHDTLGQQYTSPEQAILHQGSDIIIVGRGILQANNPLTEAQHYRRIAWQAYKDRLSLSAHLQT